MSNKIEYLDGFELMAVQLDPGVIDSLKRVSTRAGLMLFNKDLRRQGVANDVHFWERLECGTERLKAWAAGSCCKLLMDGTAAFDAHLMICLMASQPELTWKECMDLDAVLDMLEEVVPVILDWQRLPPLDELLASGPPPSHAQTIAQDIYTKMQTSRLKKGHNWQIRLAEALRLRELLGVRHHPATRLLWHDLSTVTRPHRDAIRRLAEQQLSIRSP